MNLPFFPKGWIFSTVQDLGPLALASFAPKSTYDFCKKFPLFFDCIDDVRNGFRRCL